MEMDGVDIEALKQLVLQLATIAQQLDRRSELAVARVDASTAALDRQLQALNHDAVRFVGEAIQAVGKEARQALAQGAGGTIAAFNRQLQASADAAQKAASAMEEQRRHLVATRRTLAWQATAVLLAGSLLAVGVAGYVGWRAAQQVRSAQFAQDIVHATGSGALTRCGSALCVKVDQSVRRYDKNPAYVLIAE
jgi:hypothetical protein